MDERMDGPHAAHCETRVWEQEAHILDKQHLSDTETVGSGKKSGDSWTLHTPGFFMFCLINLILIFATIWC